MPDAFGDLVRDTLIFMKDPLIAKQSVLATAQECRFFQKSKDSTGIAPSGAQHVRRPPEATDLAASRQQIEYLHKPTPVQRKEVPAAVITQKQETALPQADLLPFKKMLQRIAPSLKMVDDVPSDAEAKRIASAWKEKIFDAEVILLVCNNDAETLEFLKGLAKAINRHLGKTKILMAERIEKEKRWDLFFEKNTFRLIIASHGIEQWTELMRFYRAMPVSGQLVLDKIPLFVLSSAALYKSLEHKAHLWKTLCQLLK